MWTRERVIAAYQRETEGNGGVPLTQRQFNAIVPDRFSRRVFARFSDLQRAAGYESREPNTRLGDAGLLTAVANLVRRIKRIPTDRELAIERRNDSDFPSPTTLRKHFGGPDGLLAALKAFCADNEAHQDLLDVLRSRPEHVGQKESARRGFVYLMKYRKYYKIGYTNDVGRRRYDLKFLVPDPHKTIHYFETDDPRGIEAYWHSRFKVKRCDASEYFDLSREDVAAFKLRKKFM